MNTLTKLISKQITAMEIDGETMEQIIREAGMEEQMLRQLVMTMPLELTQRLMTEKISLLKLLSMNDSAGNTLNIGDEVVFIDDLDLEGDVPKIGDVLVVYTCVDRNYNYISFNEGKYEFYGHRVLKINKG